jgi:hypothetical protein
VEVPDVLLGGAGLNSPRMDNVLTAINLVACAVYLYLATGPVYGASGPIRVVQALALALSVGPSSLVTASCSS